MSFAPFLAAPLAIQIHAIAAIEALILGAFVLNMKKGGRLHRVLGYVWVTNMAIAILSSWFIHGMQIVGPFGPIHLLSAFSTYALIAAIVHAKRGNIAAHRGMMRGLYFGGLCVAGVLAFLPGRVTNRMLFPEALEQQGFYLVAGLALILWLYLTYGRNRVRFSRRRVI